jgi:hypothetical protein
MRIFDLFNSGKNDKLIATLKGARADFDFDKKGGKTRLLAAIEEQQLSTAEQKIRELNRKSFLRRHRYASGFALFLLVIVGTGAALAEADISNPGSRFHAVDQLGEKLLQKLPLTEGQKNQMQVNVVDERTQELDYLLELETPPVKTQAVKESQRALSEAVEKTRTLKESHDFKGHTAQSEKYDQALIRLEAIAQEQERKVQAIREKAESEEMRKELDEQLEQIRKARTRARWQDKAPVNPIAPDRLNTGDSGENE